jgi:hypothetical protein
LFDAADLEIQERLQGLNRPSIRHLERLENALTAWAAEPRSPTIAALAFSAGVPMRICEVLLADLEQAALFARDVEGRISLFLRRYFGVGTCDRCRAQRAATSHVSPARRGHSGRANRTHGRQRRPAHCDG